MSNSQDSPHTGGVTISAKLTRDLIYELKEGRYKEAKLLPSEVELSQELSVSRSVVRDALANLEREGFVARYRGIGTVVQRSVVDLPNRVDLKIEYNEIIRGFGNEPSSDKVSVKEGTADEHFANLLNLPLGEPLLIREKRVLADKKPVLFSVDTMQKSLLPEDRLEHIDWGEPIFDILEREVGIVIDTDIARFQPVLPPEIIQQKLEIPANSPLICIQEVGYQKTNWPIFHTLAHYTDYFTFTVLRKKF